MSGRTFSTKMKELLVFESVDELIADCKRSNSLLWMMVRDLSEDYRRNKDVNTVNKLEKISEALAALVSDLSQ